MSGPTVSVVIPVYDTEDYLPACLDSVLGQTFSDIEVVCVDDGSSDGSPRILKERAAADERLVVLENPDGSRGPGAARNLGIERARGDYLAFVDSDDLLAPTMLEELVEAAREGDADIAMCMVEKFTDHDDQERFAPCSYGETIPRELDGRTFTWRDVADQFFVLRFTACNKLYARSFLDEHETRFSEDMFYEDLNFTYRAMLQASAMRFVREGLYLNRRQRPGATTFVQGSRVFDAFEAMEQLETFLRSDQQYEVLIDQFEAFRFNKLRKYLYKNDPDHILLFYDRLQDLAQSPKVEGNPHLSEVDRRVRDRVVASSGLEYITADLWEARTKYARSKRREKALAERNQELEQRVSSSQRWTVQRVVGAVRRRVKRLLRRAGVRAFSPGTAGGSHRSGQAAKKSSFSGYRRDSKANVYDAVDFIRAREVLRLQEEVHGQIRDRLRDPSERLSIGLVVNEAAKWNASSLVRAFADEERIDARLYLTSFPKKHDDEQRRRAYFAEQRRFFAAQGLPVTSLHDEDGALQLPIEDVEADVFFLQQPWGMKDYPRRLVDRALTVYLHYGFMMMANHGMHYNIGSFHPYLWRYFAQTDGHRLMHIGHDPAMAGRITVTGYPKLDVYLEPPPSEIPDAWRRTVDGEPDKRVIFAPHHALGKDNLGMSTFRWTHEVLLQLAIDNPQIQWVYKPHPGLRDSVVRNEVMTREEYLAYECAWAELPNANVYDTGAYFGIFRTSDALITDCGSFLAEYLPSGGPIVWLTENSSVGLNKVGRSLADGYYAAGSTDELLSAFEQVIVRGDDPLTAVRKERSMLLFPSGGRAADRVVSHLKDSFGLA
jgi:glycosyltransferase involved in cell wall biosynthesis